MSYIFAGIVSLPITKGWSSKWQEWMLERKQVTFVRIFLSCLFFVASVACHIVALKCMNHFDAASKLKYCFTIVL